MGVVSLGYNLSSPEISDSGIFAAVKVMNFPSNPGTSGAVLFISVLIYSLGKFPSLSGAHAFRIRSQPGTRADRFTSFDTVNQCSYLL